MNFVVAELDDSDKPIAFYTTRTAGTLELIEDLQQALVFNDKTIARAAQATYQNQFADKEISVLPVIVSVTLAK